MAGITKGVRKMKTWRPRRLGLLLMVLAVLCIGAAWGVGTRLDVKERNWGVTEPCADGCVRGFYAASYKFLECRYARLLRSDGVKRYIITGWTGNLDIAAEKMSDGKPFPPELPNYRKLTAQELADARGGNASGLCPLFYDGVSAAESSQAPPLHGYEIPVVGGD